MEYTYKPACVCIHIYNDTSLSTKHCSNSCCAICTERWGYDRDIEFVHSGVDRGWHYLIISVSLTHAAAFCNLNTQQFQLLLSQCKAYGIVM